MNKYLSFLSLVIISNLTNTFYAKFDITHYPFEVQKAYKKNNPWQYIDFNVSMQTTKYPRSITSTQSVIGIQGEAFLSLCRNLFDQYNLSQIKPFHELKIPKIIHQIWLGSPLPEVFKKYITTWVEHHIGRDWQYKLWTDDDVKNLKLYNQEFYDETDSMGVKSDILKWELVYRFGGVYVDMDFECLCPLDVLHYTYDFYTALQPLDTQFVQLGAALFAAPPGHPILKHCIETVKDDWHKKGAPTKTGPVHFTKSFFAMAGKNGSKDIAFPSGYFYPLGCLEKELKYEEWRMQGAFAIHHWAKSWMPVNYRPNQFKTFDNTTSSAHWND